MITKERFLEIFKGNSGVWVGDNAHQGCQIIAKYTDNVIQGAGHDEIYSADIDDLIEAGITEDDVLMLRSLNWMIGDSGDHLACFV